MTSAVQPQQLQQPVQPVPVQPQLTPTFAYVTQPMSAPTVAAPPPVQQLPPPPAPMPPQQSMYPVTHYAAPPTQGYHNPGQTQPAPPVPTQQYAPPAAPTYQQNLPPPNHSFSPPNPPPQNFPPPANQPVTHAAPFPNPPNGGYGPPGSSWEMEPRRWGPEQSWNRNGPPPATYQQPTWSRSNAPPNPRTELYPVQNSPNPDFPPLQPTQPRPTYSQQFNPPQRNDQWQPQRNATGEQAKARPDNTSGGPVRNHPRQQNPRNSNPRPQNNPPYEKPTPPKPTVYRQSVMPYFTTVKGEFTQLCVYTAQEKPCPEPKCKFSHVPKPERPCPAFHTPKEKCPFDTRCFLGHAEAREAVRQSKAFAKHKEWQSQVKTNPGAYGEVEAAESGTAKHDPTKPPPQHLETNPMPLNTPIDPPAPHVLQKTTPDTEKPVVADAPTVNANPPNLGTVPAVNFQTLVAENAKRGNEDELHRLSLLTQALQSDMEKLKQSQTEKDTQMRTLQTAMGTLQAENHTLQEDNESKLPILDAYYQSVFKKSSRMRSLLDLNITSPSEKALEGLLVIIATMYSRPRELDSAHVLIDLFENRPITCFSADVSSLQSLGLNRQNDEHAFFLKCYMKFPVDPSFAKDGVVTHASAVVSLPPGGACPPRASILRKAPKRFRKLFFSQTASGQVTSVPNPDLNLSLTGGLSQRETLPSELHHLITRFSYQGFYKNPAVPLISQFTMFLQNDLSSLDTCLLKYKSPVYQLCPLKLKEYKNGRSEVIKNTEHPAYDKWESLINRVHFDSAYATTRLTFGWKGFYLPKGKIASQRDKCAFFSFAYVTDLLLGALPLWPTDASSQFQLDRKDPLRHYTIDNVRWLSKPDNMANKPSTGKPTGSHFKSTKDVIRLLHSCERNNIITTEILGALTKGYGTA